MIENERLVRELYSAAEGAHVDPDQVAAMFTEDGYMRDMSSGTDFRGHAIGQSILGLLAAFPDLHRELLDVYVAADVVVVELAMRGTHDGVLPLASGNLEPTGKSIDMPSCDVFHLKDGKIAAFRCYNEASVMQQQLGVGAD